MTRLPDAQATTPDHLAVSTVEQMTLDQAIVVDQSAIYVDPMTQGLYLERYYHLNPEVQRVRLGQAAIMRCVGWEGQIGYVADLRYVYDQRGFSILENQDIEDVDWTEDPTPSPFVPISARTSWNYESLGRPIELGGNREFFAAAMHLAELVDGINRPLRLSDLRKPRVTYYAQLARQHEAVRAGFNLLASI